MINTRSILNCRRIIPLAVHENLLKSSAARLKNYPSGSKEQE
jgi:hypothetical protein